MASASSPPTLHAPRIRNAHCAGGNRGGTTNLDSPKTPSRSHLAITPPLRGSRRSRAGSLNLPKGRRRLLVWGDFNVLRSATSVNEHVRNLHRHHTERIRQCAFSRRIGESRQNLETVHLNTFSQNQGGRSLISQRVWKSSPKVRDRIANGEDGLWSSSDESLQCY